MAIGSVDSVLYILTWNKAAPSSSSVRHRANFRYDEVWVNTSPESVSGWQDFTYQYLFNAYGHMLALDGLNVEDEVYSSPDPDMVPEAPEFAARRWLPFVESATTLIERVPLKQGYGGGKNDQDETGFQTKLVNSRGQTTLVIRTEVGFWRTEDAFFNIQQKNSKALYPLREVTSLAMEADTRYGAIFADIGMVLFGFTLRGKLKNDSGSSRSTFRGPLVEQVV